MAPRILDLGTKWRLT